MDNSGFGGSADPGLSLGVPILSLFVLQTFPEAFFAMHGQVCFCVFVVLRVCEFAMLRVGASVHRRGFPKLPTNPMLHCKSSERHHLRERHVQLEGH